MEKLQEIPLPTSAFGEGLTILNDEIFQLTWQERDVYVYSKSLNLLRTLKLPSEISFGWGLCNDGTWLYVTDGSSKLFKVNPENFEVVESVEVKSLNSNIHNLNELEWVDGEIWANVYFSKFVARISPSDGKVLGWINLSDLEKNENVSWFAGFVLNGIAVFDERIFVTGKNWQNIYEIEISFDHEQDKNPRLR
jgi:glutaminyl-peptide cyclotransferase